MITGLSYHFREKMQEKTLFPVYKHSVSPLDIATRSNLATRSGTKVSWYMSCRMANLCGRKEVSPDVVTYDDEEKILFHTVGFGMCGFGLRRKVELG